MQQIACASSPSTQPGRSIRAKVFDNGIWLPLSRKAKARVWAYANRYTEENKQPGQHIGPISRTSLDVLRALLYGFHNEHTGGCFPSIKEIALKAKCCRDSVSVALLALENSGTLIIQNRFCFRSVRFPAAGLLPPIELEAVRQRSNAYHFRDPQGPPPAQKPYAENPPAESSQDSLFSLKQQAVAILDQENLLDRALLRLGRSLGITSGVGWVQKPA